MISFFIVALISHLLWRAFWGNCFYNENILYFTQYHCIMFFYLLSGQSAGAGGTVGH